MEVCDEVSAQVSGRRPACCFSVIRRLGDPDLDPGDFGVLGLPERVSPGGGDAGGDGGACATRARTPSGDIDVPDLRSGAGRWSGDELDVALAAAYAAPSLRSGDGWWRGEASGDADATARATGESGLG